ncbi:hypothetical protein B0H63DRAFT_550387 [Podospora didyma]|uniref:RRM domain-containing protein n=1 Tax=Podospora didyma TaxID=330526 RepID=A0AAE0K8R9_9PEZI|nr:hypothetical protein B0H63DRAFT_550387 [Podospora didyma]
MASNVPASSGGLADSQRTPATAVKTVVLLTPEKQRFISPSVNLYTNIPEDAKCTFSLTAQVHTKRSMKHILPPRNIVIWSKEKIQQFASSIRQSHPGAANKVVKPQIWEDLYEYFDAADLWNQGAWNLWEVIMYLAAQNDKLAYLVVEMAANDDGKLEILGDWVYKWLTHKENRDKLRTWDKQSDILKVLTPPDWADIGPCGLTVLGPMAAELGWWYHEYYNAPTPFKKKTGTDGKKDEASSIKEDANPQIITSSIAENTRPVGSNSSGHLLSIDAQPPRCSSAAGSRSGLEVMAINLRASSASTNVSPTLKAAIPAAVVSNIAALPSVKELEGSQQNVSHLATDKVATANPGKRGHKSSRSGPVPKASNGSQVSLRAAGMVGPSRLPSRASPAKEQPSPTSEQLHSTESQQRQAVVQPDTTLKAMQATTSSTQAQAQTQPVLVWHNSGPPNPKQPHRRQELGANSHNQRESGRGNTSRNNSAGWINNIKPPVGGFQVPTGPIVPQNPNSINQAVSVSGPTQIQGRRSSNMSSTRPAPMVFAPKEACRNWSGKGPGPKERVEPFEPCGCHRCTSASRSIHVTGFDERPEMTNDEKVTILTKHFSAFGQVEHIATRPITYNVNITFTLEEGAVRAVNEANGKPIPILAECARVIHPYYSKYCVPRYSKAGRDRTPSSGGPRPPRFGSQPNHRGSPVKIGSGQDNHNAQFQYEQQFSPQAHGFQQQPANARPPQPTYPNVDTSVAKSRPSSDSHQQPPIPSGYQHQVHRISPPHVAGRAMPEGFFHGSPMGPIGMMQPEQHQYPTPVPPQQYPQGYNFMPHGVTQFAHGQYGHPNAPMMNPGVLGGFHGGHPLGVHNNVPGVVHGRVPGHNSGPTSGSGSPNDSIHSNIPSSTPPGLPIQPQHYPPVNPYYGPPFGPFMGQQAPYPPHHRYQGFQNYPSYQGSYQHGFHQPQHSMQMPHYSPSQHQGQGFTPFQQSRPHHTPQDNVQFHQPQRSVPMQHLAIPPRPAQDSMETKSPAPMPIDAILPDATAKISPQGSPVRVSLPPPAEKLETAKSEESAEPPVINVEDMHHSPEGHGSPKEQFTMAELNKVPETPTAVRTKATVTQTTSFVDEKDERGDIGTVIRRPPRSAPRLPSEFMPSNDALAETITNPAAPIAQGAASSSMTLPLPVAEEKNVGQQSDGRRPGRSNNNRNKKKGGQGSGSRLSTPSVPAAEDVPVDSDGNKGKGKMKNVGRGSSRPSTPSLPAVDVAKGKGKMKDISRASSRPSTPSLPAVDETNVPKTQLPAQPGEGSQRKSKRKNNKRPRSPQTGSQAGSAEQSSVLPDIKAEEAGPSSASANVDNGAGKGYRADAGGSLRIGRNRPKSQQHQGVHDLFPQIVEEGHVVAKTPPAEGPTSTFILPVAATTASVSLDPAVAQTSKLEEQPTAKNTVAAQPTVDMAEPVAPEASHHGSFRHLPRSFDPWPRLPTQPRVPTQPHLLPTQPLQPPKVTVQAPEPVTEHNLAEIPTEDGQLFVRGHQPSGSSAHTTSEYYTACSSRENSPLQQTDDGNGDLKFVSPPETPPRPVEAAEKTQQPSTPSSATMSVGSHGVTSPSYKTPETKSPTTAIELAQDNGKGKEPATTSPISEGDFPALPTSPPKSKEKSSASSLSLVNKGLFSPFSPFSLFSRTTIPEEEPEVKEQVEDREEHPTASGSGSGPASSLQAPKAKNKNKKKKKRAVN